MFRFLPYIVKGMIRHRTRSTLTILGAAVGVFVFCCVGAVQDGLHRLTTGQEANQSLIVFQENRFCPTTSKLPVSYVETVAGMNGVVDAIPIQVYTNNCRASLDIVVFNGLSADKLRNSRQLNLLAGDWSSFEARRDAAIVGTNIAKRRGLGVGSSFTIGEITVQVVGVFESPITSEENLVYTHLEFLQRTRGVDIVGTCTQIEARLSPDADPDVVASAIDAKLRSGPVATVTRRKGAFQTSTLGDLIDLISFANWLGYASVGLVLSLVATTTLMAAQDRIKEHAVLQVLGVRPFRVARFIVAESLLTCLIGGGMGTLVALLGLAWSGFAVGAEGATIAFEPSPWLAAQGAVVSLVVGVLAGVVPAWQAARSKLVVAMNQA